MWGVGEREGKEWRREERDGRERKKREGKRWGKGKERYIISIWLLSGKNIYNLQPEDSAESPTHWSLDPMNARNSVTTYTICQATDGLFCLNLYDIESTVFNLDPTLTLQHQFLGVCWRQQSLLMVMQTEGEFLLFLFFKCGPCDYDLLPFFLMSLLQQRSGILGEDTVHYPSVSEACYCPHRGRVSKHTMSLSRTPDCLRFFVCSFHPLS